MPGWLWACEGVVMWPDPNKRVSVLPDCSFENAGPTFRFEPGERYKSDPNDNTHGEAAKDQGFGKVSQITVYGAPCYTSESLVISDCSTKESISISGSTPGPDHIGFSGHSYSLIEYSIAPKGPLRLPTSQPLSDYVELARKHKIWVYEDAVAMQASWKQKDRFDPFCGCKLFYPESRGAM